METKRNKGLGIAALVLGIIGLLLSCFVVGIIFDILAVILGIVALSDKTSANGLPIAGISTGAVGIFIVLIMLFATAGDTDKTGNESQEGTIESQKVLENKTENEEEGSEPEKTETEKTETKTESEEHEESAYINVGDSFEKVGLKITVNEANTDFQDYDNEYGWNAPSEGMKYIMVSFTFENQGKSDTYVSIYDFDCYADNTTCEQVYTLDKDDFISTSLSSGRNVSFKTYYTVPENAESIELEYETNAWTKEKVVIKLQ